MLDPSGIVTSWNPGAKRFKGYEESEIIGEHFSRFYSDEDQKTGLPQKALATAAREGKFENEGWRKRKDGSRFCLLGLPFCYGPSDRSAAQGRLCRRAPTQSVTLPSRLPASGPIDNYPGETLPHW